MKISYISILTFVASLLCAADALALPAGFFAKKSRLAEGNWVKVSTMEEGVYEISYDELRAMGFSNPEKVSVYGRGGYMLDTNFQSVVGSLKISDDLSPVGVMHRNGKLFFYACGVERHDFHNASAYAAKGYYQRVSKNIYSNYGYYFLTDSEEPVEMKHVHPGSSSVSELTKGVGLLTHELDLVQNNSNTGQLFFGEKLCGENSRMTWDVVLPGALSSARGTVECQIYTDRDITGTFGYGFDGLTDGVSKSIQTYSSSSFRPQEPTMQEMTIPGEKCRIYVECQTEDDPVISHLDFWSITYQRSIPTLRDPDGNPLNQECITFPTVTRGKTMKATFGNGGSLVVLDVTEAGSPKELVASLKGEKATVYISNETGNAPKIIAFDPARTQKRIRGYERNYSAISNQNLHGAIADGADLLIIYVPVLKEQAERLADLHRRIEGLKVVTASAEEVYNEFSQGIPDAMAYRTFVKAAYSTEHPVKNLLLLGPITADFRGINEERNPYESLIAYQSTPMNQIRGAQNANDFYGMMDDVISDVNYLERATMHVGVGVLPCRFPSELATIVDKIEEYLGRTDFAYFSNRLLNVGGVGDNHSHAQQALSIGTLVNRMENRSSILTPLVVDAYGYKGGHEKFFDAFEDGRVLVQYFGHGSEGQLNQQGDFFTISDVFKLRNTFHPFMAFAGCHLSNSDCGVRGLGEALITSTPYGCIGSLLATRETWSGQNMDLFQLWNINLYRDGSTVSDPVHEENLTIGEIVARTKTASQYNNELAYQLICDPALKLPLVSRNISLSESSYEGRPGEWLELTGNVLNTAGEPDTSYDGEVVIRIMVPFEKLESQDLTGDDGDITEPLEIVYADTQAAMSVAEVKQGKFTAKIFIPASMDIYAGKLGRIHFCAYSAESGIVAGTMLPVTYMSKESSCTQEGDTSAPVIETFEYSAADNTINVSVRDNLALNLNRSPMSEGFMMHIDGRPYRTAERHEATVGDNGAYMATAIPLRDLTSGTHSAVIKVSDVAGNVANAEIVFTYDPYAAKFAIALKEGVVNGFGTFCSLGTSPSEADLVILNSNGFVVYRGDFKDEFVWDGTDLEGNPVAPGLYKAYIIEKGDASSKGHSATIDVPVV